LEKNQLLALEQENQQIRQQISKKRATLQKNQKLCLERNILLAQEQEQLDTRRDLTEEKEQLQEMQQKQEQQRKELVLTNLFLSNLKREQAQEYQVTLQEHQKDYKRKYQQLCLVRNILLAQEQEQLDTRRGFTEEKEQLQEMQQKQERQRKELVLANLSLSNLKREQAQEYQAILQKKSSITT